MQSILVEIGLTTLNLIKSVFRSLLLTDNLIFHSYHCASIQSVSTPTLSYHTSSYTSSHNELCIFIRLACISFSCTVSIFELFDYGKLLLLLLYKLEHVHFVGTLYLYDLVRELYIYIVSRQSFVSLSPSPDKVKSYLICIVDTSIVWNLWCHSDMMG